MKSVKLTGNGVYSLFLIKDLRTQEYNTLREKDENKFYDLVDFFDKTDEKGEPIFNFEVITDKAEIKKIVKQVFNSKGRGEEYIGNMPSVSQIASKLYPIDIATDKYLLRWKNNEPLEVVSKNLNNESLSKGTYIHKILELFVTDRCSRNKDKSLLVQLDLLSKHKDEDKEGKILAKISEIITHYCEIASIDEEILHKIPDFESKRVEYEDLAHKVLPTFITKELIHTDCIYSEVFIKIKDFCQGSIDLICYKNGEFTICDFKTTSSIDKNTGKRKFKSLSNISGYIRQVALYYELLKHGGYLQSGSFPKFIIYQIHLIGKDYKVFEIPEEMIRNAIKQNKEVIEWYWATVNS